MFITLYINYILVFYLNSVAVEFCSSYENYVIGKILFQSMTAMKHFFQMIWGYFY